MEAHEFVSDIYLPQMLHALIVRSPVAKGRLVSIECPQLPEDYTLLTAEDIPGENSLGDSAVPILASGELSYIGEPVALLLGPDKDLLEKYVGNCKVVAEEASPVFSMGDSAGAQVAAKRDIRVGDPEGAFASAASIVKSDYETGIQEHWYSETCGAVAWIELQDGVQEGYAKQTLSEGSDTSIGGTSTDEPIPNDQNPNGLEADDQSPSDPDDVLDLKLIVHTATQWPFHVRYSVVRALGPKAPIVQVKPCESGLHLDGKFWYPSLVSCHAALGAWITGRPVRMVLSKKEDFCFSPKRFGTNISISSAFDEKGELIGTSIEASVNVGAYGVGATEMLDQVCLGSLGIYAAKNICFNGTAYRTNIPPQGPFAGFGLAQGLFAQERHASLIADSHRKDPAEWRKQHFPKAGTLSPTLPIKDVIPWEQLVNAATNMSDYNRKWASYELLRQKRKEQLPQDDSNTALRSEKGESLRGIGIAIGYQGNGLLHPGPDGGNYGVELVLEKDGSLEIKTGMPAGTIWENIALETLSVDAEHIRINRDDETFEILEPGPATMSRKTTALAELIEQACLAIQGQRFREPLPISARETAGPIEDPEWNRYFGLDNEEVPDCGGFLRPGSAAAVVEVEIDPLEFVPRIRGVWLAVDGGRVFRERKARSTLRLSVLQALGWAYQEKSAYVSGRIPDEDFVNFDIASASEIPPIGIDFIHDSSKKPKGIGDLPFACVPAAYLQAVSQAMDRHFRSIPLKAQDIWLAGRGEGGTR